MVRLKTPEPPRLSWRPVGLIQVSQAAKVHTSKRHLELPAKVGKHIVHVLFKLLFGAPLGIRPVTPY
jgi:hypothetical protein